MVLTYLGVSFRYSRLLELLQVQPFGTPGHDLRFLDRLGINIVYRDGDMLTLVDYLTSGLPCIVLVKTDFLSYWQYPSDHAVVVIGLENEKVYLNDPAFAEHPIKVTHAEFELAWMEVDYRFGVLTTGSSTRA